jgi:Tol biopolymer transport system component
MKKQLVIVGITLVLLAVGFSGCTNNKTSSSTTNGNTQQSNLSIPPSSPPITQPTKAPGIIAFINETNYLFIAKADGTNQISVDYVDVNDRYQDWGPKWSPDGTRLAYTHSGLCVVNKDGAGKITVPGDCQFGIRWSPDSTKICYESIWGGLYAYDFMTSKSVKLGIQRGLEDWSPDSQWVCYQDNQDGYLYIVRSDGSEKKVLSKEANSYDASPIFSGDGTKIAFVNYKNNIDIINFDGTGLLEDITPARAIYDGIGNIFIFSQLYWGSYGSLASINTDGTGLKGLGGNYGVTSAQVSPDGKKIVFLYWAISVVNIDGTGKVDIDTGTSGVSYGGNSPSWSPDSQWISYRTGDYQYSDFDVFISKADGTQKTKIIENAKWVVWSPIEPDIITSPDNNIYWLAKAIMSEASIGTQQEQIAVGWCVLNRLHKGSFGDTMEAVVKNGFAWNQEPTQQIKDLANDVLEGVLTDPTDGALYFFSPKSMPKEGENVQGYDVGGGLHIVPGTLYKVYFPSWAEPSKEINEDTKSYQTTSGMAWTELNGIRNWYFMFYHP